MTTSVTPLSLWESLKSDCPTVSEGDLRTAVANCLRRLGEHARSHRIYDVLGEFTVAAGETQVAWADIDFGDSVPDVDVQLRYLRFAKFCDLDGNTLCDEAGNPIQVCIAGSMDDPQVQQAFCSDSSTPQLVVLTSEGVSAYPASESDFVVKFSGIRFADCTWFTEVDAHSVTLADEFDLPPEYETLLAKCVKGLVALYQRDEVTATNFIQLVDDELEAFDAARALDMETPESQKCIVVDRHAKCCACSGGCECGLPTPDLTKPLNLGSVGGPGNLKQW